MNQDTRNLKIEETGDFYRGKTKPAIRLIGNWLRAAGFNPGDRVIITNPQPGMMIIVSQPKA